MGSSKGNILVIIVILGLISLIGMGGFLYWQNSNSKVTEQPSKIYKPTETTPVKKPELSDLLSTYPVIAQVADPSWKKISVETTFTFQDGAQGGPNTTHIVARIPSSWQLKTTKSDTRPNEYGHNCSIYSISNPDQTVKLTLQIICGGWSVKESDTPTSSIVVTRQVLRGNDGPHISTRYRISNGQGFSYFDGLIWVDINNLIKNSIGDVLELRFPYPDEEKYDHWWQAVQLTLSFEGSNIQVPEDLEIADKIASTLYLE